MTAPPDIRRPSSASGAAGLWSGGRKGIAANVSVLVALVAVLPAWVHGLGASCLEAWRGLGREPDAQRAAEQVAGFGAAVEALRGRVEPGGAYVVAVGSRGAGAVTAIALRVALLPRKPILVGRFSEIQGSPGTRPVATVTVENDETPPVVGPAPGLSASEGALVWGVRDDSIPAAVDEVTVTRNREIGIRGWCQEKGGIPCDVVAVLIRGLTVPFVEIDRHPRPDVAAVLSGFRPTPRAGYRVQVPAGFVAPGAVEVQVVFRTADGRTRTYERVAAREVP